MTEDLRALAAQAVAGSTARQDPDYPRFHLAPPVGRLNDPNGLLVEGDTAHAFFQFTPMHVTGPHHKLVYWGHATSKDLVHWEQHEPAIIPDSPYDANGAYSGSALILGEHEAATAPEGARWQFFYTGNLKDPVTDERTASQVLVTSHDLETFTKWPGGPVLPTHAPGYTAHFRDPQVTRDPRGGYRMLLGVQRENLTGAMLLYRSTDLLDWQLEGEITFPEAGGRLDNFGYMWECPNLITLTDEETGEDWDVLIFCPQGVHPTDAQGTPEPGYETIFPCVYLVGHLDGTVMRDCDGTVHEVDRGFEFYAPQCVALPPEEDLGPALMGWAGNASEDDQPSIGTGGWVHCLTLGRCLSLRHGRLIQRPLLPDAPDEGPGSYMEREIRTEDETGVPVPELEGERSWHMAVRAGRGGEVGVRIGSDDCHVDIRLTSGSQPEIIVDRSTSRYHQHGDVRRVSLPAGVSTASGSAPRMEIIHDRSITEIYVGRGELVLTLRSFVDPASTGASVWATSPRDPARLGVRALL